MGSAGEDTETNVYTLVSIPPLAQPPGVNALCACVCGAIIGNLVLVSPAWCQYPKNESISAGYHVHIALTLLYQPTASQNHHSSPSRACWQEEAGS